MGNIHFEIKITNHQLALEPNDQLALLSGNYRNSITIAQNEGMNHHFNGEEIDFSSKDKSN